MTHTPNIDAAALAKARERLEPIANMPCNTMMRVECADIRIVLDALTEARRQAFEEAEQHMYDDDVQFVTHHGRDAWTSCIMKLRALAAKEQS